MKNLKIILLLMPFIWSSCKTGLTSEEKAEAERLYQQNEIEKRENALPDSNWVYHEQIDEMTGEKSFYATCTSRNKVEFGSPYQGGSRLDLTIRNSEKRNLVMIRISEGLIQSDRTVRIKFDEKKPINCSYQFPSDGSSDVIFINDANKIIQHTKTADSAMVEVPFYQEGSRIFYFKFDKLNWEH